MQLVPSCIPHPVRETETGSPDPRDRFPTAAAARQALAALDPPAPPILPEIFRPRPKSPHSGIVPRPVPVPRVVAVPKARAVIEETLPMLPEETLASGENEPPEEAAAAPEGESGASELAVENVDAWPPETAAADLAATPSPDLPPEDFSTGGPVETVLHRDLAARPAFAPNGKGGEWFYSFLLAHSPTTARTGVYELQANVFSETAINDVIRLSFTETAGRLTVVSFPARGSATLPGAANLPQRLLLRCQATPAGPDLFHVTLDLWANPNPAALGPPLFSAAASKVPLPKRLGVLFQKKPTLIPTTTVIESLVIGKTATEVLK